jgi:hypothetical protein
MRLWCVAFCMRSAGHMSRGRRTWRQDQYRSLIRAGAGRELELEPWTRDELRAIALVKQVFVRRSSGTVEVNDAVVDYFAGQLVASLLVGGKEQAAVREVERLARLGYLPRELDMCLRQVIDLYEETRSKRR